MTALAMFAGKSVTWKFTVLQADGSVQPLTSTKLRWTAKAARVDADAVVVLTRTSAPVAGVFITDAAAGLCEVRLVPADTIAVVPPVELYWDLQIEDAAAKDWLVDEGILTVGAPTWAGAVVTP